MVSWGNKAVRRRETFISVHKKCESIGWQHKDSEERATSGESRKQNAFIIYDVMGNGLGREPRNLGSILKH